MTLIDPDQLLKNSNFQFFPKSFTSILMSALQLDKINNLYAQSYEKRNIEFIGAILDELEIKYQLDDYELDKIPDTGPFITVSNHPYGGLDGLLLLKLIGIKRADYKLMGNFLLQRIEPIENFILPVNPFESFKKAKSSVGGLKKAFQHLHDGHALGIFPAGEVSSFNHRSIQDKQWVPSVMKFIKKANVPVVPIYFHGNNSALFHLLGLINPLFRTAKLPSELLNKKNKTITIRIGTQISVDEQNKFTSLSQYSSFLRAKTYALGSAIEVKRFYYPRIKISGKPEKVASAQDPFELEKEITSLPVSNLLLKSGSYQVFCASSNQIPITLNELGRLRELTFRDVGEGTNRSIDLDEFDLYYQHLFIWDESAKKIVGAYRIGKGNEIIRQYGRKGFYVNTLFKMKKELTPFLKKSLEMGRSFIVKEYQKKPASLFLLWKGILYFLLKHPEYQYLFGPVSISNHFSSFSKSLIIDFVQNNFFHSELSQYIEPRKKFKVEYKKVDRDIMLNSTQGDINKLDKIIEEIEPQHFKIPVLLKKYLKQNAKILGFNVDPHFNEALDGLIFLDLYDIPMNTIISLSKELNDESIVKRFQAAEISEE